VTKRITIGTSILISTSKMQINLVLGGFILGKVLHGVYSYTDEIWWQARQHLDLTKKSLMNSSWPADHGDVARSKYTLGSGLPKEFDPANLRIDTQEKVPKAQWMYTYGNNSEILFVMSGFIDYGILLSKVNSVSLDVLQQIQLAPAIYMGG
jgi:hypothetical protein